MSGFWVVALDAAELPEEEARELERLVLDADVFSLPRLVLPQLSTAVDVFQYELKVTWGKDHRHIVMDDTQVPARLRLLLSYLAVRAGAT